jgi:SET domain-containing protein
MTTKILDINEYTYLGESKIHNKGVFALKKIPVGTKVLEYTGEIISKAEGTRREEESIKLAKKDPSKGATYIFEIDDKHDLDGDIENNYAKYINHSCEVNCKFIVKEKTVWIVTTKTIPKDAELLINYGIGWDENEYHKHPCKCGSKKCVGYILDEEHWPKLTKHLKKLK